jgi:hypothetical protein
MSLFDVDDVPQVEVVRAPSARKRASVARAEPVVMPGLERPYEAPNRVAYLQDKKVEDVAHTIAQWVGDYSQRGEYRLDAVSHTLVLMFARQMEFAMHAPLGIVLHPKMKDGELEETFAGLYRNLTLFHGADLFPPMPIWPVRALRKWTQLWHGYDMIGGWGSLEQDAVSLAFSCSANMTGKQKGWGAFYTPMSVSRLIAEATLGDEPWNQTLLEPCCGAGSMMTAAFDTVRRRLMDAQRDGRIDPADAPGAMWTWTQGVQAVDIDPEAAWACAAQMAVRTGYRIAVFVGNALGLGDDWRPATHPYRRKES